MPPERARHVLEEADLVHDAGAVQGAIRTMADEITRILGEHNPLIVVVMHGGVYLSGQILPLLEFPLGLAYVHVTRYGQSTSGGALTWKALPSESVRGRTVLGLADILDIGQT